MSRILKPTLSIRKRCIECAGSALLVKQCKEACPLSGYKSGHRAKIKPKFSPVKSLRKYCLWCCCDSLQEPALCEINDCTCWPYKQGTNPTNSAGKGNLQVLERFRAAKLAGKQVLLTRANEQTTNG